MQLTISGVLICRAMCDAMKRKLAQSSFSLIGC